MLMSSVACSSGGLTGDPYLSLMIDGVYWESRPEDAAAYLAEVSITNGKCQGGQ